MPPPESTDNAVRLVAVVGPTASGKSDLAVQLAQRLDGEIINADAMQLYRGMDIGTAKLPPSARGGVPHHLLDVLDVAQEANVASYQRHALEAVQAIWDRGRVPIVVGGSGLYVHALVDDLQIPPTDPQVRARWEAELLERGSAALHAELARVDPTAASTILPSNGRRIVRALEVVTLTGQPFSATLPQRVYRVTTQQIGLRSPRPELDERIAARVDQMWQDGLVAETQALVEKGLREGKTASRALGYAQVLAMLDGSMSETEAKESVVTSTRRFARRQESWFGRDDRIAWLTAGAADLVEQSMPLFDRQSALSAPTSE